MQGIDLRALFSRYHIPWRDHGANCSRGHVNINCPFCGSSDRGFHLGINEDTGQYLCFRNPKHAGNSPYFLLNVLKIPKHEFAGKKFTVGTRSYQEVERDYSAFRYFSPAEESLETLNYLSARLFQSPLHIARTFNLKFSREGRWAGRLIIPMTVGWTGRSMRQNIEPRYLSETDENGFFFYSNRSSTAILVEGAIDAMKIAAASGQFDLIGKCGNRLSSALILLLRENNYKTILNVPDGDVPFLQFTDECNTLSSYFPYLTVRRLPIPAGHKDAGEMQEDAVRGWLMSEANKNGQNIFAT